MFGHAPIEGLRLERWARNRDNPAAVDNDGVAGSSPIVVGAPRFLQARGRLRRLRRRLQEAGVPVEISRNAGGFVCNHVYYHAFERARRAPRSRVCLFVHVGDWQRSAKRELQLRGAHLLIDASLDAAGHSASFAI
jgi:pyroglutamyl-peptidase